MADNTETDAQALDKHDLAILAQLQSDGRLTNQDLAERVGLSASACWRRVKALEENKVILRYVALVDAKKVGMGECVFAHITLTRHSEVLTKEFADAIRARPEVLECFYTTGDSDILLRVVATDVSAYYKFLQEFIFKAPGVLQIRSNFALDQIKFDTALPIGPDRN